MHLNHVRCVHPYRGHEQSTRRAENSKALKGILIKRRDYCATAQPDCQSMDMAKCYVKNDTPNETLAPQAKH